MSFPRYPNYKDSGVEWLGEVPVHWEVKPVRNLASIVNGYPFDSALFDAAEGFPLIRIRDLNKIEAETFYKGEFVENAAITSDDVLIGMDGDFNVGRWRGAGRALLNQRMCCVRGKSNILTRLLEYALPIRLKAINDVTYATTVKHLASSQVEKTFVTIPPDTAEQTQIAAFLDRETAKIDDLVAEQRRLMELLKEKRQAVISHAVTQGLNPHAPMKPSGIEWLGDVPAHWTVASIRRVVRRIEQGWSPDCFSRPAEPDEWGVVKSGCVNRGVFVEQENKALPETLDPIPEYEIHAGDVLMSRASGSPELVGSTAYITATRPKLMLSDKIFRIHFVPSIDREFFVAVFNSRMMRSQIERAISGAEGLANNLPQSAMKGFFCVVPSIDEQRTIVNFLATETAKFDTLTAEAQRAIDLLQERRTALISAAVTGQIDVRPH